jgi:serine/threonine protein kinase
VSEPTQPVDRPAGQRYRLETRIAIGGMGEVWRATDTVLGREVALKLLKSEYAGDPTFRSRFETEARNAAALHHPNVASVFDFGELPDDASGPGRAFLVMELVRGEPLSALLKHGEPMPADTAADLVAQAADALAAAHDLGIVHRDVKPANLLVTQDRQVKITDFGIARAANAVALTQTGQVIGTPQYLSPEQAEGKQATPASDIYSLGVVLYECLAGRRPFDGDSPIATALAHLRQEPPPLPDDVPAGMRAIVATALAKRPEDRFATVRDLSDALRGQATTTSTRTSELGRPSEDEQATRVEALAPVPAAAGAEGGATTAAASAAAWEEPEPARPIAPPPERRGLPGWLPWLLVAAVVLVGGFLLLHNLGGNGDPTAAPPSGSASASPTKSASRSSSASPSPSRSTSASPTTVQVTESDYLGDPRSDARAALRALGLRVREVPVANPDGKDEDTVAAVSPTGSVPVRSLVTLSYFEAPAGSPTSSPTSSPTTSPTGEPSSEPASPSATASSSSPGNGNGNGNGGGHGNGGGGHGHGGGGGRGGRR